jgi:hypothetical protein
MTVGEKVFEFNGRILDISTVLLSVALAVCLLMSPLHNQNGRFRLVLFAN